MNIKPILNALANGGTYTARLGHSGDGLGNFKESLLNIVENNSTAADTRVDGKNLELKVMKLDSNSMLTTKTKVPDLNLVAPHPGYTKKGTEKKQWGFGKTMLNRHPHFCTKEDRYSLYFDVRCGKQTNFHGTNFEITRDEKTIWLASDVTGVMQREVGWTVADLMNDVVSTTAKGVEKVDHGMLSKLDNMMLTRASSEMVEIVDETNSIRNGKFKKATLYLGFERNLWEAAFDSGKITVSIRVWGHKTMTKEGHIRSGHDHGPAYRVSEPNIKLLYTDVENHVIN